MVKNGKAAEKHKVFLISVAGLSSETKVGSRALPTFSAYMQTFTVPILHVGEVVYKKKLYLKGLAELLFCNRLASGNKGSTI